MSLEASDPWRVYRQGLSVGPAPYYEDANAVIYHGDSLDILPRLGRVDHVITDPPYARDVYVRLSGPSTNPGGGTPARPPGTTFKLNNGARMAQLAAGAIGSIDEMLADCATEFARLAKRWCIVFSDVETCHVWREQLQGAGLRYIRTGAWVKADPMPQMSGDRPGTGFEPCTIAHVPGPMRWNGGGHPAVWTHNTSKGASRPDHPCPKPLSLMRNLVTQFTDPGEVILDPFAGSGTTLVAAALEGRRAIGIECEERWCEAAANRLMHGDRVAAEIGRGSVPLPWEVGTWQP